MKKIEVDKSTCIGCGMCVSIAPDIFEIGSDSLSEVKKEIVEDGNVEAISAKDNCPVQCISVSDISENEKQVNNDKVDDNNEKIDTEIKNECNIEVDKSACIGCGACVSIAPDAFEFDEDGLSSVIPGASSKSENVQSAAESCPTSAIHIKE